MTRTCGDLTTFEDDSSDFNLDRTSVLFQTNRRSENIGFFMVVTCVSPEFYNLDGCTQAWTVAPPKSKRETEIVSSLHIRVDHMASFERVNFVSVCKCRLDFDFNSPVTSSCQSHCYDLDMVLIHSLYYISAFNKEGPPAL